MKPNIVLFMTDQHRFDAIGCSPNPIIETPHIDWLASEGTVFDRAYTPSPSCIPARACLMTGQNPWHTGILGMGAGQSNMGVNFAHTLPGELAKHGYYTQAIGKMHFYPERARLGFHDTCLDESGRVITPGFVSDYTRYFREQTNGSISPVDHGLDWNSWMARPWPLAEHLHPNSWTAAESVKAIENRDPTTPFFMKISFERPHSPYDPPPYYFDMYQDADIPMPWVGSWAHIHDVPADAAVLDAWRGKRSDKEIRRARAAYYGLVSHIDNQIGRVLIALKDRGMLNNTLFIFTSDHGDMLGDHHLWRKTYAYEGSAHIPLIVKLPASMRKDVVPRSPQLATLYDIMPTLLEAADIPIPDTVDGSSLLAPIRGDTEGWRAMFHGEHARCYANYEMQYVTDGRYKYIWQPQDNTEQFFDLSADPSECHNDTNHVEMSRLRQYLIDILAQRNNGTVAGGKLVGQAGKPPQVSPHYQARLDGSAYKWQ